MTGRGSIAAMALVCIFALAPGTLAAAEIAAQANFDDGTTGPFDISQYGEGDYVGEVVEGMGPDGSACLRLVNARPGSASALVGSIAYERGHTYTMTFNARTEGDAASVSCFLDAGDYRNKFPTTYSDPFILTEEWQQCHFEQLHLEGRGYVVNIRTNAPTTAPVLIDDVLITRSEGRSAINWAAAQWKSIPSADSVYAGYQAEALNDGIQSYAGTDFTRRAMATEDAPGPHWVQVTFPAERDVQRAVVYWNAEENHIFSARRFEVQALVGEEWLPVAEGSEAEPTLVSAVEFDALQATAVRIVQPEGAGPVARPEIMWVAEVEVY